LLNFDAFDLKLDTDTIGRNFIYCEEIDSTNNYLMDSKLKNDSDGTVVFAERQIAGKGRKDRKWYSSKDQNLTFSILLKNRFNEKTINVVNLGTAVSIAMSLENLYQLKVNLKWPNDVLINDKKAAGILLESSSSGNKIDKLVIGVGINVNQTSFQGTYNITPTSIKLETGTEIDRERLLAEILNNFEEVLVRIDNNPNDVLNDWRNRCRMIGERVFVTDDNLELSGIFDDIDEQGFILLKSDDKKIKKIHFGDVSVR